MNKYLTLGIGIAPDNGARVGEFPLEIHNQRARDVTTLYISNARYRKNKLYYIATSLSRSTPSQFDFLICYFSPTPSASTVYINIICYKLNGVD